MNGINLSEVRDWCSFCREFEGDEGWQNEKLEVFLKEAAPKGRIVLNEPGFVVVPSLGPLVVGHVLIVPREHYLSVGGFPLQLMERFVALYATVWNFLQERFGDCIAFEHGCAEGGRRGGACVDHAHMHLLPVGVSLTERLSAIGQPEVITDLIDLARWHASDKAYLFYESADRVKRVWSVDVIPSQLMRMHIAAALGEPDQWDWRADFGMEKFLQTIQLFERLKVRTRATYASA